MRCLTDVELQLVADDEAGAALCAHAAECATCRDRLEARRRALAQLVELTHAATPSPGLASRVRAAVHASPHARGATVLRPSRALPRRPLWVSGLAAVAAAIIIAFVVLPRVDAPATLSASQIIDRSIERMTGGTGIERLEYELVLASTYRRQSGLPEGPYRVIQTFDRRNPARFRFLQYDRDGVLVAATSQDPAQSRRSELLQVDGRNYIVHVSSLPGPLVSIPQLLQTQAESILRMMQLNADDHLTMQQGPAGPQYVIELPEMPAASAAPMELTRARVVIDATDYRVQEFTAAGSLLGLPFDVSIRLLTHEINGTELRPDEWAVPQGPGDVAIEGDGAGELNDSMTVVLRELGRLRDR